MQQDFKGKRILHSSYIDLLRVTRKPLSPKPKAFILLSVWSFLTPLICLFYLKPPSSVTLALLLCLRKCQGSLISSVVVSFLLPHGKPDSWDRAGWNGTWWPGVGWSMGPAFPLPTSSLPASASRAWPSFQWPQKVDHPWRLWAWRQGLSWGEGGIRHPSFGVIKSVWPPSAEEHLCEDMGGGEHPLALWGHWKCSARYSRALPSPGPASSPRRYGASLHSLRQSLPVYQCPNAKQREHPDLEIPPPPPPAMPEKQPHL